MLYDVHQILVNNNITYWADGGTLLGSVRHGGIIPWDDDIDIGILSKDIRKFLKLKKQFKKCGYSICERFFGYKIFCTNRKKIKIDDHEVCYSFPFIDVLLYRQFSNGTYRLSRKDAREEWPKEVWKKQDLFPITSYKFGSYEILGPNNYLNYFNKYYGKDWNKIAYREYDHSLEEEVKKVKVKLTDKMRQPAQPIDKVRKRLCVKTCLSGKVPKKSIDYWKKKSTKTCSRSGKCYNNFKVKMGVYVINCLMHKQRYNKFKKYAAKAKVNICRIPCILGKNFDQSFICKMVNKGLISPKANMNPIEVSINMSHYNCWQRLINSCEKYALILEDDVELKSDFIKNINIIMEKINKNNLTFSILHLWNGNWQETADNHEHVIKVTPRITIVKETEEYNAGAVAYIISRKYAKFLMNHFFPIKWPQDILMGSYINKGNHYSLKMKYDRKNMCYVSPLFDMDCGGIGGTGNTTQNYHSPIIGTSWSCDRC